MRLLKAAVAAALFLGLVQPVFASPADSKLLSEMPNASRTLAPDPAVRRGVLPNGLRYLVMHNATPVGALSIRLGIDTGSFEENDNERGVAHFIEHMAFNGTRHFAEGKLDGEFAHAGVAFGRDLNASTGMFETNYRIDFSHIEPARVDMALTWLRDIGDGMDLDDAAVARERGVILSEREARLGPQLEVYEAVQAFQRPGQRSTLRSPIGTVASVSTMTGARLRGFYDRWYRPENAVVVIVGDEPAEELEAKVKATFETWKGRGPAGVPAERKQPDPSRGLDVLTLSRPDLPSMVELCRLNGTERAPVRDADGFKRKLIAAMTDDLYSLRLDPMASQANPPFAQARGFISDGGEGRSACVVAMPVHDDWKTALKVVETERRRFAEHGPTGLEVYAALAGRREQLEREVAGVTTRASEDLASRMLSNELNHDVVASPQERMRVFDIVAREIDADDLKAYFREAWSGSGPLIAAISPQAPTPEAVKTAWAETEALAVPEQVTDPDILGHKFAYEDFGTPGKLVKREEIKRGDFVRLTFSNGLVVDFKHTEFKKAAVDVGMTFGAGRAEMPNDQLMAATIATSMFAEGGVGKHSYQDLRNLFGTQTWNLSLDMLPHTFVLKAEVQSNNLENELKILAAYFSDPGFRPDVDARLSTAIDSLYRYWKTEPEMVVSSALNEAVAPGSPNSLPPKAVLEKLRSSDFDRLLRPAVTRAPLEIGIVGDVDEASVVAMIDATFAALPARKEGKRDHPDAWFLRFPKTLPGVVRATHEGSPEKAMVGAVWPLYVAEPKRRHEEYALDVLAQIMSDDLRHRIREDLGKTYSPGADTSMPDFADQGQFTVSVEAAPGDTEVVASEIRKSAQRMARGEITAEQFEAVRRPLLEKLDARTQSNEYWLGTITGSAHYNEILEEGMLAREIYGSLTLEDIRQAARTWLARDPIVVIAMPAKGAAAAAAPPAPTGGQ